MPHHMLIAVFISPSISPSLFAKVSSLQAAKQWEEAILPQIFGGAPGDAQENELEREVDLVAPRVQQVRQFAVSYGQAYELTSGARKQLNKSVQCLESAMQAANLDTVQNFVKRRPMHNTPLGVIADVAKRQQSRQGSELANAACDSIIKAAQIIPDMPRIDLKRVQALRGIGIIDIAFDNIATDLIARRKIQNALEMARTMAADVVYAEKWLEGWLAKVKTDMAAIDQEYIAKKGALDNYRRQLMQQLCRT